MIFKAKYIGDVSHLYGKGVIIVDYNENKDAIKALFDDSNINQNATWMGFSRKDFDSWERID